jgi:hypothetical protein
LLLQDLQNSRVSEEQASEPPFSDLGRENKNICLLLSAMRQKSISEFIPSNKRPSKRPVSVDVPSQKQHKAPKTLQLHLDVGQKGFGITECPGTFFFFFEPNLVNH